MSSFATSLRAARLAAGLNATEAATLLGVQAPRIHEWESGKRTPRPERQELLLRQLNSATAAVHAHQVDAGSPPLPGNDRSKAEPELRQSPEVYEATSLLIGQLARRASSGAAQRSPFEREAWEGHLRAAETMKFRAVAEVIDFANRCGLAGFAKTLEEPLRQRRAANLKRRWRAAHLEIADVEAEARAWLDETGEPVAPLVGEFAGEERWTWPAELEERLLARPVNDRAAAAGYLLTSRQPLTAATALRVLASVSATLDAQQLGAPADALEAIQDSQAPVSADEAAIARASEPPLPGQRGRRATGTP